MKKTKKLKKDQILHLAKLSHLHLSENEIHKFQTQLTEIIDYIDKLNSLDTKSVETLNQVTGLHTILREDDINLYKCFSQKQALENARKHSENMFTVDAIL